MSADTIRNGVDTETMFAGLDHHPAGGGEQMTKKASTTVRYETRTTIDRPISDVFARLADLDGYRTWMRRTGLFRRSGQTSDGPLGLGTDYFDATRMGTFRGEVTDYEPPTGSVSARLSAGSASS